VLRCSNGTTVIHYYRSVALNFSLKVLSLLELANSCCAFYIFFFVLELLIRAFYVELLSSCAGVMGH
jgi:hypothetical protein